MNIKPERVEELRVWLLERRYNSGVRQLESINDLLAILSDYEKMRAEIEHRCDQRDAALESIGLLSAQLAKVKADFSEALKIGYDQQADLEKFRPLIEAVMGAELFPAPTDGRTCIDSHEKIIREALKLRGGEGK